LGTRCGSASMICTSAPQLFHARELDADDSAAEHDDLLRNEVELQRLLGGDDAATDLEPGKAARVRTGGEHHVLARDGVVADLHGGGGGQAAGALDGRDAARLQQALQAFVLAGDDALAVLRHSRDVDALELGGDPELRRLAGEIGDLGRVQQGLGRDAADMQAGAADLVLLDETNRQTQLGGADRSGVSATPGAQHDKVKILLGHPATPSCDSTRSVPRKGGVRYVQRQGFPCHKDPTRPAKNLLPRR